ncbi:MAG: fatty acid desaturase [Mycobacterium sp.]|jgi:linoleoyl-CoA desaturase|nr:fatty acid desaturase [Mycobacterium sp.]
MVFATDVGLSQLSRWPVLAFMSGNLCYQIEHHLFPDLPSNRYVEIAERVRALCDKYDLLYTTGSLGRQYWQSFWTIAKMALPDKLLRATAYDPPETHSELKFRVREGVRESSVRTRPPGSGAGLGTALREMTSGELITA